jgi:hypothetical protein
MLFSISSDVLLHVRDIIMGFFRYVDVVDNGHECATSMEPQLGRGHFCQWVSGAAFDLHSCLSLLRPPYPFQGSNGSGGIKSDERRTLTTQGHPSLRKALSSSTSQGFSGGRLNNRAVKKH